ncbi:MAG: hypothetical protein J5669_02775 [Bacteroidales bacterium]|nr:hypothetical protein [Bacteroidales bacterium]
MKKIILLLAVLFVGLAASAQVYVQRGTENVSASVTKKKVTVEDVKWRTGWQAGVISQLILNPATFGTMAGSGIEGGYRFPFGLYAGALAGYSYGGNMGLFAAADVRYYFMNTRIVPFVELEGGVVGGRLFVCVGPAVDFRITQLFSLELSSLMGLEFSNGFCAGFKFGAVFHF